jgi:uncharacterized protein DUF6166
MKLYKGERTNNQTLVTVNGTSLDPRFDLWLHSLDGFEWGHGTSGSAQLALAVLANHLNDDKQALALHYPFMSTVIAKMSQDEWQLTSQQIDNALKDMQLQPTT